MSISFPNSSIVNFPVIDLKFCLFFCSMLSKLILNFSVSKVSLTFKLVINSEENILLNKILSINKLKLKCAHFSFSLLILSILFNNIFSSELITNLKVNETFETEKFKISFESIEQKNKQNFKSITGKFTIEELGKDIDIMQPELRIYNQPNIITSEADIKINLFYDKFMTMNYVQNEDYFNIRYQFKPFMFWIWLSTIMLSLSGFLSLAQRKYEK